MARTGLVAVEVILAVVELLGNILFVYGLCDFEKAGWEWLTVGCWCELKTIVAFDLEEETVQKEEFIKPLKSGFVLFTVSCSLLRFIPSRATVLSESPSLPASLPFLLLL